MERGLRALQHDVVGWAPGVMCDLVMVFNQTAHVSDYVYPEFPPAEIPVAFIDAAEYGWTMRVQRPLADFWNAFAPGSVAHPTKNAVEQERLRQFLAGRSFPYFIRELFTSWAFPPGYHPIDYPLHESAVYDRRPVFHEYARRNIVVSCLWGLSNPWRVNLTAEIRSLPYSKDVYVLEHDGPRLPHSEYWKRIERSRASVSFDGYGSGSFRMTEVLARTVLVQGLMAIRVRAPVIDGDTCYAYALRTDGEVFVGSTIAESIRRVAEDVRGSFEVYRRGYDHCMTHLTERATAQYVLDVVNAHDWSQPTQLEMGG
jgi:hypothetical protein